MNNAFTDRHTPKLLTCLREGYALRTFASDLLAGLTVAVIALPLSVAMGIASIPANIAAGVQAEHPELAGMLSPPAIGLYTVVVAGFVAALAGGSRVQVSGPTAAFIPVVFAVASTHGYEGLALATIMAGVILVLMGFFRFGALIKFIPYPVTTGITSGIAVGIIASQVQPFLGLRIYEDNGAPIIVPAQFVAKLRVLGEHAGTISWHAVAVGCGSLIGIMLCRRFIPKVPSSIVVVVLGSAVVALTGWSGATVQVNERVSRPLVETIGTSFGGIPSMLPTPHVPKIDFTLVQTLIPTATSIALLCAIASLLSAVVADGMTGFRHRSDQELVAQGAGNIASACFFGMPASGAIARTVANIKMGATTPVAAAVHALALLAFMILLAPLARFVPLPTLAAVLIAVAMNIAQIDHFRAILRAPKDDVLVLLTTFGLMIFTDLTIGVGVGMVLASMLFMRRMAAASNIAGVNAAIEQGQEPEIDDLKDHGPVQARRIPPGVEVFEINGPFFFGVADRLKDTLRQFQRPPKVFILRMRYVPHIDATGLHALEEFRLKCVRQGTVLLLGGVHVQPLFEMVRVEMDKRIGLDNIFESLDDALKRAKEIVEPTTHVPPA